ncbi:MAG: tRNA uridine-5-carboxymethylaminomethyl(34) synthesis GTPase MnmE [Alphaproteobacteria bacterium]|nr:tRNA uridine-5-carboxymethylaminomethyl(34) synthesis GTPase MnmE [Alphaproteobacteria bacterium]
MAPVRATIFALSSGRPPAAIAVVRISGPRAGAALEALSGRIPKPRQAALARLRDPASGETIDEALALWFPGPHSETGEDVAELQVHGGRAVIAAVLAALGRIEGLRPAEPGEFTRRAFDNGKLDLTAVEGLADLIGAETEAQRRQAYRQLKGLLGDRAESWRSRLIQALASVEARIDFSDEADVPEDLIGPALDVARSLRGEIEDAIASAGRGERLRDGLVVAIAGPPNAGKSTLLNRIARREAAIVSPVPGTTRDVIEVHLDLGGYPVTVLDTAGIRSSDDPVEQEGVRRAQQRAAEADLVLWVEDVRELLRCLGDSRGGNAAQQFIAAMQYRIDDSIASGTAMLPGTGTSNGIKGAGRSEAHHARWVIANKLDQIGQAQKSTIEREFSVSSNYFLVSASTGEGMNLVIKFLEDFAKVYFGTEPALVTRERHRRALTVATEALDRALAERAVGREDIIAEELRLAAAQLGRLTGRIDVEDVLDSIFRDFCIGK